MLEMYIWIDTYFVSFVYAETSLLFFKPEETALELEIIFWLQKCIFRKMKSSMDRALYFIIFFENCSPTLVKIKLYTLKHLVGDAVFISSVFYPE